jgi:hypothetical protein
LIEIIVLYGLLSLSGLCWWRGNEWARGLCGFIYLTLNEE